MSFLDLLRTLERITRPPRRNDEPAAAVLSDECRAPGPADCLSCGKRCRWPADEKRPDCSCGLGDGVKLREHWSSCAVWDDDEAAKLADMEAEMDRQVGEAAQYRVPMDEVDGMFIAVAEPQGGLGNFPGPVEPALTDDELVAVRGLIQERYDRAQHVPPSLEFHQQLVDELTEFITVRTLGDTDSPAASAPGDSGEAVSPHPPVPASPRSDRAEDHRQWVLGLKSGLEHALEAVLEERAIALTHEGADLLDRAANRIRKQLPVIVSPQHTKP